MELKTGTPVRVTGWIYLMGGDHRGKQGIIIGPAEHKEESAFWVRLPDREDNLFFLATELTPIKT